ncbi:DELLA protein RGL2-like [Cicer arietinum]|uniref:DELLA protein RGL2-like n=1 Tax=Cicer arietinum TaxID=3827 RepID=A0A1S3E2B1_CICAR|nr:DELLA protein RGL2-like [Cicer arietinum]
MFNDHQNQQQEFEVGNFMLEEINFDPFHQPTQQFQETITTWPKNHNHKLSSIPTKPLQNNISLSSLEILRNHGTRFMKNITNTKKTSLDNEQEKVSAEGIIRVAGTRYAQKYSSHWNDGFSIPTHPYGFDQWNFSEEENKDVELSQFLFAAAEKVSFQQFERAKKLLFYCQWNSSATGNSVQRIVFHFSQALLERIEKETRRFTKGSLKNEESELLRKMDLNKSLLCHIKIPFNQVMQFIGIQAIVEHVVYDTRIHLIDLDIKSGVQCIALMQALIERQDFMVEIFKVTAVGLNSCKNKIEETGKNLASFAESLKLPFLYKCVLVEDMMEIKEVDFEIEENEAVAVYSPYFLRSLISRQDCMENLMRVLRYIKPSIMIILEMEASHNSPSFVNRFMEALFFYSAFFDVVETCMKEEDDCRMMTEAILSAGIRNIVGAEGRERNVRNVKIDVWRRFFARYRMVESGFSEACVYQGELVAKEFVYGKFCNVEKNGKCLILGWKGTPMHSISAWRFL